MDVGLLYSGGKDSTLAALLLERFCDLTLLCGSFGVTDGHEHAQEAAAAVDLPARRLALDPDVAREAAERIVEDGFPRNGIQTVHEHALEQAAAGQFDAVADGTRRDDRVPTVPRSLAQSIEDRLAVETGPSAEVPNGDYETELRALIAAEYGEERVAEIFPEHVQSRVTGRL